MASDSKVFTVSGKSDLMQATYRMTVGDFVQIGEICALMVGFDKGTSPRDVFQEASKKSGELVARMVDEAISSSDDPVETTMLLCAFAGNLAGTLFANLQMMSHDFAIDGFEIEPIKEILGRVMTPPRESSSGLGGSL